MKTIRVYRDPANRQLTALVELSHEDLRAIDVVDYSSIEIKMDPAAALKKALAYEARAAARIVSEMGLVEIATSALQRIAEWGKAARQVKVSVPALWLPEPEEEPAAADSPEKSGGKG